MFYATSEGVLAFTTYIIYYHPTYIKCQCR